MIAVGTNGKRIVYEEKAPFSKTMRLLILVVMILSIFVSGFFKMKFRITEESVEAVMPPFSYRVLLSERLYLLPGILTSLSGL